MSHEKSKKSARNSDQETLDSLASLKGEVRRGLSLLDQCVNNIAQAKWILISVETSIDQIQGGSSGNAKVPVVKKELNTEDASPVTSKVHTSTAKPQTPTTSKDTNVTDSVKKKTAQVESVQTQQGATKEKTEVFKKQTFTARRTGGDPGRAQSTSKSTQVEHSSSQPKLNSKKLSQLENLLRKAKLTQVSLQCVATIMRGRKSIDINEIPKCDPKFKLNCKLKEGKKKLSSGQAEGSSSKQTLNPAGKEKSLKSSSLAHNREYETKKNEVKHGSTKIRKESQFERKNSSDSHRSRKDSVHSRSSSKLQKRRHSSSSSSSSRSCSTCSSSTIETIKAKDQVGSDKPKASKKPKAFGISDDDGDKKAQHKIKVSKDTFSVIKSKASSKYHEDEKGPDKVKSKLSLDHNGNDSEKSEYKSKEKKSGTSSEQKIKTSKSEESYDQRLKAKRTEVTEKSKDKSEDQKTNDGTSHDPFDKLKANLGPKENSKRKETNLEPLKNPKTKESYSESSEYPKKKELNMEASKNRQIKDVKEDTSHSNSSKQNETNTEKFQISEDIPKAIAVDTPVAPEMEDKFQRFLRQLKATADGKTELKDITKPHPLFTEARQKGIASLDSPEFKLLILAMFRHHQAMKEAAVKKAAEQAGKENDAQTSSTSQPVSADKKDDAAITNHTNLSPAVEEPAKEEMAPSQSRSNDNDDDAIPEEDTELYNEARRLGINSKSSEEYRNLVDHVNYMKFKQSKGELLKSLINKTQNMFPSQEEQSVGDDEADAMELGEDVIGNCLDVITSTAVLQSEAEEPSSTVPLKGGENVCASIGNGKDSRKLPEAVPTPILTLQDTVSPTAMEKFFSNDTTGE